MSNNTITHPEAEDKKELFLETASWSLEEIPQETEDPENIDQIIELQSETLKLTSVDDESLRKVIQL